MKSWEETGRLISLHGSLSLSFLPSSFPPFDPSSNRSPLIHGCRGQPTLHSLDPPLPLRCGRAGVHWSSASAISAHAGPTTSTFLRHRLCPPSSSPSTPRPQCRPNHCPPPPAASLIRIMPTSSIGPACCRQPSLKAGGEQQPHNPKAEEGVMCTERVCK